MMTATTASRCVADDNKTEPVYLRESLRMRFQKQDMMQKRKYINKQQQKMKTLCSTLLL